MSNRLQSGAAWLARKLKGSAPTTVVYRRGSASVSLTGTLGQQLLRVDDGMGNTRVVRTDRDIVVTASDLVLSGRQTTPQDGDLVDIDFGGSAPERYEVLPVGSEASWRYEDPYQTLVRVHLKHIGAGVA